jgi:hypothetical protein
LNVGERERDICLRAGRVVVTQKEVVQEAWWPCIAASAQVNLYDLTLLPSWARRTVKPV